MDLNIKPETFETTRETGKTHDIGIGNRFLKQDSNCQGNNSKN
jgi:hypothetical protein